MADIKVTFRPEGTAEVDRAIAAVQANASRAASATTKVAASSAAAMGDRLAGGARQASFALEQMARTGKVAGEGMKQLISVGSDMAFAFGPTGAIVGAIGVTIAAILLLFKRSNAEAEKFFDKINDMRAEGDKRALSDAHETLKEAIQQRNEARQKFETPESSIFSARIKKKQLEELGDASARVEIAERNVDRIRTEMATKETKRLGDLGEAADKARKKYAEFWDGLLSFKGQQFAPGATPADQAALSGGLASWDAMLLKSTKPKETPLAESLIPKTFAADLTATLDAMLKQVMTGIDALTSDFHIGIRDSIANAVAGGIFAALTSGSIGEAFNALTQTLLSGFAGAIAELAVRAIMASKLMTTVVTFLAANPWVALAAATALLVMTRSMGGGAKGGGGSIPALGAMGASGIGSDSATRIIFGSNSAATAAGMEPRQANQFIIIGSDDPRAQREILSLINKGKRRGG